MTPGNLVAAGPTAPVLTTLVSVNPIYASFDADEHSVEQALATLPGGHDFDSEIGLIPVQMGTLAEEGTPHRANCNSSTIWSIRAAEPCGFALFSITRTAG